MLLHIYGGKINFGQGISICIRYPHGMIAWSKATREATKLKFLAETEKKRIGKLRPKTETQKETMSVRTTAFLAKMVTNLIKIKVLQLINYKII